MIHPSAKQALFQWLKDLANYLSYVISDKGTLAITKKNY